MTPPPTACLVFKTDSDLIACGGAALHLELVGEGLHAAEAELVREAAAGVLHYFRTELGRESVTVGEFSTALVKALRGFGLEVETRVRGQDRDAAEADLTRLVSEGGGTFELGFYPRLREELARQLEPGRRLVRFTGLRHCVKQLAGARRWCGRCEMLSDQIVEYVRECLRAQRPATDCAVVVL